MYHFLSRYEYEPLAGFSRKESVVESISPATVADSKSSTATFESQRSSYYSVSKSEEDESREKFESGAGKFVDRVDSELSKVIVMLEENPKVVDLVREIEREASQSL